MADLRAELAATIKALEEERAAHAAEHRLRLERERELSNARRRIEQLLETIREKDEALRQLTEEAKKAVIRATDFLADAVRKQQEELQGQLVLKMTSVGGEIDQVAAAVSRPTTADGILIPRDDAAFDQSMFAAGSLTAQQMADAAAIAADDRPGTAASAVSSTVSSDRPGTAPTPAEPEPESEALAAAEAEVAEAGRLLEQAKVSPAGDQPTPSEDTVPRSPEEGGDAGTQQ